jgi:hypothetical protein
MASCSQVPDTRGRYAGQRAALARDWPYQLLLLVRSVRPLDCTGHLSQLSPMLFEKFFSNNQRPRLSSGFDAWKLRS